MPKTNHPTGGNVELALRLAIIIITSACLGRRVIYCANRDNLPPWQSKAERKSMNKMMHAVVLVVFGGACWFLSLILKLPMMVLPATARLRSVPLEQANLPAFTRHCMVAGPVLLATFSLSALGYCIYVWMRKTERPAAWTGFLATTMSALVVLLLPAVVAIYIPLVDFLNWSTAALPK
jgi:hypothetical protein